MITPNERKLIVFLVRIKAFNLSYQMRNTQVGARRGFQWILKWLKSRQVVDQLHHAPYCPANHWHRMRLVLQRCNCGSQRLENKKLEAA